jgi:hypothetical protein
MASAKSVLEKMIAAMNRGRDAAKNAVLKAKDIDTFAKPTPKKLILSLMNLFGSHPAR